MAKHSTTNRLLSLFLSLLTVCSSSGTLVGFSCDARRGSAASPLNRTVSLLMLNKVSSSRVRVAVADHGVLNSLYYSRISVDLRLYESVVPNCMNSKASAISWLKTHVVSFLPSVNIKSITLTGSNNLFRLLSALKLVHSAIGVYRLESKLKVSVAFSLPFLEKLNRTQERGLRGILGFIKSTGSFVTVEVSVNAGAGLGMKDLFLQSMIQKAALAASLLPCNEIPIVMIVSSVVVPSAKEADEFLDGVSKSLEKSQGAGEVVELYAEVYPLESSFEKVFKMDVDQSLSSSRRELQSKPKTVLHDVINPSIAVLPTAPLSTPQAILPNNPTPTVVSVPATNPVTITPVSNPSATPLAVPSTNPSVNPPAPITNPITTPTTVTVPGAQPINNPVTTYPAPAGNVPVTTPVSYPVASPETTNAPAIAGQSWCVAKSGVLQTALQAALDYACGMGGADCSQIQQGGSCNDPDNLQNHASYAFNSYYQKNPVQSSCNFGGTAAIVNVNPSVGSCIYPSFSASSLPTPSASSTNPVTTTPLPGSGGSSTGTPPSVLNSSSPASGSTTVFGSDAPSGFNSSTPGSATGKPCAGCLVLPTFFVIGMTAFNI